MSSAAPPSVRAPRLGKEAAGKTDKLFRESG
jgi:hypothetical protein